jgi:hypothetical protein
MVIVSDELPYQSICVYLRNNQRDGHLFWRREFTVQTEIFIL